MKPLLVLSLLTISLLNAGCSQKQAYHGIRGSQKSECQRIEDPDSYRDCMDDANQSYDDYQREREALIADEVKIE